MRQLFIFYFLLLTQIAYTQQSVMFETTIYVKDAIGNMDSVVIGYDTLANYCCNPEFGEVNITTPFDSILEMRTATWLAVQSENPQLSKKTIASCEKYIDAPCFASDNILLFVQAKYQPVTFYWNTDQIFDAGCHEGAFITPSELFRSVGLYWLEFPDVPRACMTGQDSFQLYMSNDSLGIYDKSVVLKPGQIGNTDTIFSVAILLTAGYSWGACTPPPVSTDEPVSQAEPNRHALRLYPNPAQEAIQIESNDLSIESVRVFDCAGHLVTHIRSYAGTVLSLDIRSYMPGMYFTEVLRSDHTREVGRFVKGNE